MDGEGRSAWGSEGDAAAEGAWRRIDAGFLAAQEPASGARRRRFFEGGLPDWSLLVEPEDGPALPLLRRGWDVLSRLAPPPEFSSFHLLRGTGADGKSTLLRQVATRLAAGGELPVFWLEPTALGFDATAAVELAGREDGCVFVVDDAHRRLDALFALMRRSHRLGKAPIHLVAATLDADWDAAMRGRGGWSALCEFRSHRLGAPDAEEAAALVQAWSAVPEGLGDLADWPEAERARRVGEVLRAGLEDPEESLFGGILELRCERGVVDEVDAALDRLVEAGPAALRAFAAVALVDAIAPGRRESGRARPSAGVDSRLIADLFADDDGQSSLLWWDDDGEGWHEVLAPLLEQAPLGLEAGRGLLRCRHRRLADCAVHRLASGGFERSLAPLLADVVIAAIDHQHDEQGMLQAEELQRLARDAQRQLPAILSHDPEQPDADSRRRAHAIAVQVAEEAWESEPSCDRLLDCLVVKRRADGPAAAAAFGREHAGELQRYDDRWRSGRAFLRTWARAEQGAARADEGADPGPGLEQAAAVALYAVSDDFGGKEAPVRERELGHVLCLLHEVFDARADDAMREPVLRLLAPVLPHAQELAGYEEPQELDPRAALPAVPELRERLQELGRRFQEAGLLPESEGGGGLRFSMLEQSYRHHLLSRSGPLFSRRPREVTPDGLFEAFEGYFLEEEEKQLSEEQETAILHILSGENVVLATATGTGKSTVALAAHFAALCADQVSVYTAPTKALVNEKFFDLCEVMGARNVGLVTGDSVVNPEAPVLCCTAEILMQWSLRQGEELRLGWVIMDEFHYVADRARGVAWTVPLYTLSGARFLVMSATLGDPGAMQELLQERSGFSTAVVESMQRPVELVYSYREWKVDEAVGAAAERGQLPAYLVHFEKESAGRQASGLTSRGDLVDAERKTELARLVGRHRFRTPFGKKLETYLKKGVGVHHSGLLPGYRRLVEMLSRRRLLGVVCGTDTLGVGVNLPIRTVIFTQLCKFDGRKNRRLGVREFHQIAGRAGRRGHDDQGDVWALAPEDAIERKRAAAKGRKKPKASPARKGREKPTWTEKDFEILQASVAPAVQPRFEVRSEMVLLCYARPRGGAAALRRLIQEVGPDRKALREHFRVANEIKRSLVADGSLVWEHPEGERPAYRPSVDLPPILGHQTVGLFLADAVSVLDPGDPDYALDVLSVVEATMEDPRSLLNSMLKRKRGEVARALMAEGIHGGELKDRLHQVDLPRPCPAVVVELFRHWQRLHPWVGEDEFAPKSIVREMFEMRYDFAAYAREQRLLSEEGVLLRYLSNVARSLRKELPEYVCREESIQELSEWLDLTVRDVDRSVAMEWDRLEDPGAAPDDEESEEQSSVDVTRRKHAFRVLVRNVAFGWVRFLARREEGGLASEDLPLPALRKAMARYWAQHDEIRTDADARGPGLFQLDEQGRVFQTLLDPQGYRDTLLRGQVDWEASRREGRAVVRLLAVEEPGADWGEAPAD